MNKQTKNTILTLAVFTALAAPLAGYALAQTTTSTVMTTTLAQAAQPAAAETPADAETNDGPDTQDSSVKGSVSLPNEAAGTEVPDAQEQGQYQTLARISAAQASTAAQAKVPGAVSSVTLGDENGSLIYEVVIGQTAVKVDAGNGQVLGQSTAEAEGPDTGTESGTETGD